MRRGLVFLALLSVVASGLVAPALAATEGISPKADSIIPCVAPSIALDVAGAAKLKLRVGKKGPLVLGMTQAKSIANDLTPIIDTAALCSDEPSAVMQSTLDDITALIDSGDWESALSQLQYVIEGLAYSDSSPASVRRAHARQVRALAEEECKGLQRSRDFQAPKEVNEALAAAAYAQRQAEAASDPDVAQQFQDQAQAAIEAAKTIMSDFIKAGADGAVTSGDWLAAAAAGQTLGLAENGTAMTLAYAKAKSAALTSFKIQIKTKCPAQREVSCAGRALAAYDMMGGSEADVASMTQTWAKSASDAVNPNKPDECKGEVYEFRYIWDTSLSDTSGDTGWIRFKVIKDKIQFQNFPVLVLVGGGNLPMYDAKTGAVLETGTFIGGEWPMDARNSLVGSSVSEGSIKLAPFFARRNNMAAYDSRWSCYMCAIGHEVNMDETWAKQDAAFAPIKDLTDGVEFARRKAAMKASGEVRWYLRYLGEG